jgi:murein DD-endopeptidase MepM/ murein hydrolase activator NlpD
MLGPTYRYNEKTCRYERSRISFWPAFSYIMSLLLIAVAFLAGFLLLHDYLIDTELELSLKKENAALEKHGKILAEQIEDVEMKLTSLREKDQVLHQKFFSSILPAKPNSTSHQNNEILLASPYTCESLIEDYKRESHKLINTSSETNFAFGSLIKVKDYFSVLGSMPLISPIANLSSDQLMSGFGTRVNPFHKGLYRHEGIDIAVPRGTEVMSTAAGTVVTARRSDMVAGYGDFIEIDHGNGFITRYAHLDDLNVRVGQKINKGQVIGLSGSSGGSVAPHLHYEILRNGRNTDPINYLVTQTSATEYTLLKSLSEKVNQSLD